MKQEIKNRLNEFENRVNDTKGRVKTYFCGDERSRNAVYMVCEGKGYGYGYDLCVRVDNICVFNAYSSETVEQAFKDMRNGFYKFIKKTKKEFTDNGFAYDEYIDTLDELKSVIAG